MTYIIILTQSLEICHLNCFKENLLEIELDFCQTILQFPLILRKLRKVNGNGYLYDDLFGALQDAAIPITG